MNNLSTQQLLLGGNILTTTGNELFINGQLANSGQFYATGYIPISQSINTTINWTSGNIFHVILTGNVNFSFVSPQDGQTIVVSVTNTAFNSFSGTWPTVSWSNNNTTPTQSSGSFTDIYTFIDITGKIYGTSVQGFK